jgi:hypothetical protein
MANRAIAIEIGHGPTVIPGASARLNGPTPDVWYDYPLTNSDGYAVLNIEDGLGDSQVEVTCPGYTPVSYHVHLTSVRDPGGAQNQTIRFGGGAPDPNDITFPALVPTVPKPLPFAPFTGAFCIPGALPGIPYGDGARIWTPAFGCYRGTPWQAQMLAETTKRKYGWIELQVSGFPYRSDYPELPLDVPAIVADLVACRVAGLRTILAFRDDQGPDLSYLAPLAAATQDLVDCVMGMYEMNGVFQDDIPTIASVLHQQRVLWPNAITAFHSTTQDDGGAGFGDSAFWNLVAPDVDVYFMQQSGWAHPVAATADRFYDFAWRLNNGHNGWPKLKYGVVEFELTTSVTYRGQPEAYGVQMMHDVFAAITDPTAKPTGFMDGGDPALVGE